ncbi:MAG: HdeD family acid-resistance protein [Anaerovoracaceae bacterium]|jgi:uncharacterized membrane protein HdeD (DUF308 family)
MRFYNNDTNYRNEIGRFWNENIKKYRWAAIISGIVMVILGVLAFFWPIQTVVIMAYVMSACFIVFGIMKIVAYTKLPQYLRTGLVLLNGIIDVLLGVMLIFSGTGAMVYTLAFFFAFDLVAAGIEELAIGSKVRFFGYTESGGFTVGGVINIVIGTILLFMPGASLLTLGMITVFFLITKGIANIINGVKAGELKA